MPSVTTTDLQRMRDALLFEGPNRTRRLSRYWMLLGLASVIATAGVIADATATVIGAMIVAPLMTPILGTVLSASIGDRANLVRSVVLVVTGAALVILIAWLFANLVPRDIVASNNSQVAGRVSPGLVDFVAAIATGAVGAFALVRSDVGDTLPGVAIAISLVPPLAVVGLTLEAGQLHQALGALLLFGANVAAILATGAIVMLVYGVHRVEESEDPGFHDELLRRRSGAAIAIFAVIIVIPLGLSTARFIEQTGRESDVDEVAQSWAEPLGWTIESVTTHGTVVEVLATGPLPSPRPNDLRRSLDASGLEATTVRVKLVPERSIELPGS